MNISHKLITLGLAFSLLGSTCAFARPTRNFENGGLSRGKRTVLSLLATGHEPPGGGEISTRGSAGLASEASIDMRFIAIIHHTARRTACIA